MNPWESSVFGLLFKKNFLSKIRQEKKKLAAEIFIPVLYLGLLCYLVTLQKVEKFNAETEPDRNAKSVISSLSDLPFPITVHIVPNFENVQNFTKHMNLMLERLKLKPFSFQFYKNEAELLTAYQSGNVSLAIQFETEKDSDSVVFNSYTIRNSPDEPNVLPAIGTKKEGLETCRKLTSSPMSPEVPLTCKVNSYWYSNFLALQSLVDQTQLELELKETKAVNLTVVLDNYPKTEYSTGLPTFIRILIPLYSVIPLTQFINNLLILIVTEKEENVKDGLRMIGISDTAYWSSWFGVYSIIIFIFSLMFTLVMHFMALTNMNPVILFLIFFLFGCSVITLAFAITPFFHKPKTAGIVGTLVLQFTSLLFMLQTFTITSKGVLIPIRLISSLAFTTALDEATANEYNGGIGWSDLTFGGRGEGVLISLLFLFFDFIFYALLAEYLDNVIPNQFGVRKHPLYIFMPSYWFGKAKKERYDNGRLITDPSEGADDWTEVGGDMEPISPNLVGKEAIRIRHIKKTYYPTWMQPKAPIVEAVKDISLNIYEGQITAILGRNGAGKSTLFNMLIGLVTPTSGGSNVFGYNTSDPYDMAKLRKMTGVCLQYDLHFNELTVEEHLEFYGKLRGLNKAELQSEISTILTDLRLKEKRNTHASKLSGGQKRKLSIGIALIGDPKIILLDEPSAGVDPVSRRHLWTLLQRNKAGKVILLTTHFMDEADILADRKVIIHDGEMKCVGSSLFLKNRFGVGYYLTVELNDRSTPTSGCDELIKKWIPSALDSKKVIASEVKYSLPHSKISSFSSLFAALEDPNELETAGIKSYGVSMTTLEEVFLKISTDVEPVKTSETMESDGSYGASDEQNLIGDFGEIRINPAAVFWSMCLLRIRRLIRSPQAVFFMLFMPVLLAGVGLYLVKISAVTADDATIDFNGPQSMYSSSDLHIALHDSDEVNFEHFSTFLTDFGFTEVHKYDGNFSSLLEIRQPFGTMGAINVKKLSENERTFEVDMFVNGTFVHSPPFISTAISNYFSSRLNESSDLKLRLRSRPFISREAAAFDATSFYVIFLLGPAFVFTSVGMVMEIVKDREIKARNHLRVNGLTFKMYFFSIFTVFGVLAALVTLMQLSLIGIFNVKAFMNPSAFIVTMGLLLLYIPPSLLFSASFSYLFEKMESAQSVFSQVASWSGTVAALAVVILDATKVDQDIVILVHSILCIVDIFYTPFGIFYFVNRQFLMCSYTGTCDSLSFSNYTGSEFTVIFFALLGQIPIFLLLLVVADVLKNGGSVKDSLRNIFNLGRTSRTSTETDMHVHSANNLIRHASISEGVDEDIRRETDRVNNYFEHTNSDPSCVLAVQSVVKQYTVKIGQGKKKKKTVKNVVNKLSLMVEEGEVFGLLGHNGAGKTTAMKLITAEESPKEGKVKLCGYDIKSNISDAFIYLGYCPQHDVLWENITLKEHLELYSAIRGILPENRKRLVDHFLFGLKIKEHAEKRANDLSGGTKRKLSYALSMLGSPKVVLLDEPSTGMDPQSKRFLWNTILGTFKESRGAMLTTHSMEEADALCTRIAIMVKGSILCIGSPQHLKTKFGAGYTLEIKLKTSTADELTESQEVHDLSSQPVSMPNEEAFAFVKESFPGSQISEYFGNRAIFSVPTSSIKSISNTFSLLEKMKLEEEIEEYSFSQTTLEQVFLGFAKENEDEEEE